MTTITPELLADLRKKEERAKFADAMAAMLALGEAGRATILSRFHSCGSADQGCQCENDE